MCLRPAVLLDRDGTIIDDVGYLRNPGDIAILPGAIEALRILQDLDLVLVIVSNQSGVGRGLLSPDEMTRCQDELAHILRQSGITLAGAFFCPHAPWDNCECRKPRPGLIHQAADELGLNVPQSFMVGDKPSDVEAGIQAGCTSILLADCEIREEARSSSSYEPGQVVLDLLAASHWIENHVSREGG